MIIMHKHAVELAQEKRKRLLIRVFHIISTLRFDFFGRHSAINPPETEASVYSVPLYSSCLRSWHIKHFDDSCSS